MPNLSFLNRSELQRIGLGDKDVTAFINIRARLGALENPDNLERVKKVLSAPGRKKLEEFIDTNRGAADTKKDPLNQLVLEIFPIPPVLSGDDHILVVAYQRQIEPELFIDKQPFTLRGPNRFEYHDVSLAHLIELEIRDPDDRVVHKRVLIPAPGGKPIAWQTEPPLGNEEKVGADDQTLYATLIAGTHRTPEPAEPIRVPNTLFERSGRYKMLHQTAARFDGYTLGFALTTEATLGDLDGVLDTGGGKVAANSRGDGVDGRLMHVLSRFSFRRGDLDFEGSFRLKQQFDNFDKVVGWLWVLTGPDIIIGFQPDTAPGKPAHDILILLAGGTATPAGQDPQDPPYDVSEKAILNRPDLFADDPGTSCKPFNSTGRILGEKRFQTVLRVTQPKVERYAPPTIFPDDKDGRPVEYPRRGVDFNNPVDYEGPPSRFQAVTVAIGHVLEHAVRYRSNGYSLGDVAYSLTLAPRQKRRIMKLDFARRERAQREESTSADDEVLDSLERERDYDNAVSSELSEWSRGRSEASGVAGAAGIGGYYGTAVAGGGAVAGYAQSSASQEGGRKAAARESQNLRDAIRRYGQSLRTLESTVVTESEQSETIEGISEVVQNINYTRSLSVIYYQILRHLRVDTEIAAVTECIFVPLPIKPFSDARISRHRRPLSRYASGWLERMVYRYLDDIQSDFVDSDIPQGPRSGHPLTQLSGSLWLKMGINMPSQGPEFEEINENTDREVYEREAVRLTENSFLSFAGLTPFPTPVIARKIVSASDAERERYFQGEIAPHMARKFLDTLQIVTSQGPIDADFTLVSGYRYGGTLRVDFTARTNGIISRAHLTNITLRVGSETPLPERSFLDLTNAQIRYATQYYSGSARSDGGTRDLLTSAGTPDPNGALINFALSSADDLDLQKRLKEGYQELKKTLEANTFRYHKAIWWNLDRDELYTLLDGFAISDQDGRSLASMAERKPIGILGNCMIFPTKTDTPLDPRFDTFDDLKNHYIANLPPADPMRISLPTDGVYARAHMDDCVAAEEHDGSFDWVFGSSEPELSEFPAGFFDSRRAEPQGLQPTEMPDSIINLQNAPAAPQVSGLADAFGAVQNANAFRDITGLEGTQANLRAAMQGATSLATSFGGMALQAKLADLKSDASLGKDLKSVAAANEAAVKRGVMSPEAARENTETFAKRRAEGTGSDKRQDQINENSKKILDSEGGGTQVDVNETGAQVIHKEPQKPRQPDPLAKVSVVPIPDSNQILFMNFRTNSASLKSDHVRALEILAGAAGLDLDDVVEIEGHASTSGSAEHNEELGTQRGMAIFKKLHALITPLNPEPDFSPAFVESAGEEGSYRQRFGHIPAIKNAPGEGHPNDPVEKAVLFTFKPKVNVDPTPKVIDFFGVTITVSGHFIFIGNKIIASTPQNKVKIVDRSKVEVIKDNVVNETFTESNRDYSVKAGDNSIVVKLDKANIGQGAQVTFNINSNNGKVDSTSQKPPTATMEHDQWLLKLTGPDIEAPRSLMGIIQEVANIFISTSSSSSPNDLFDEIASEAEDALLDELIDFIIQKVGLGPVKAILGLVRFGTITVKGDIKVKADPDVKASGTFSAPGVMIGTQSSAASAVILNNADYTTSVKLKASAWDDQQDRFAEFGYLNNGFVSSATALKEGLEALITLVLPFLPTSVVVSPVSDAMDAAVGMLTRFGGTSGVRFKAFSSDSGISVSDSQAGATGLELQIIAMAANQIAFR